MACPINDEMSKFPISMHGLQPLEVSVVLYTVYVVNNGLKFASVGITNFYYNKCITPMLGNIIIQW